MLPRTKPGAASPRRRSRRQLVAEQNALVVENAEACYRTMVRSDAASWNVRVRHMAEALARLLAHRGPSAKAIVWAHNSHIGDARFTDMVNLDVARAIIFFDIKPFPPMLLSS